MDTFSKWRCREREQVCISYWWVCVGWTLLCCWTLHLLPCLHVMLNLSVKEFKHIIVLSRPKNDIREMPKMCGVSACIEEHLNPCMNSISCTGEFICIMSLSYTTNHFTLSINLCPCVISGFPLSLWETSQTCAVGARWKPFFLSWTSSLRLRRVLRWG